MADYTELMTLVNNDGLRNRVIIATAIAAEGLLSGTPTADQQKWAASVFSNPKTEGRKAFLSVLAANNTLTLAQFGAVTDAQIQTGVDNVVPSLIIAFNAT